MNKSSSKRKTAKGIRAFSTEKPHLLSMTVDELSAMLLDWGEPAFRAKQVCDWVFDKKVSSFDQMRNIPAALRSRLSASTTLKTLCLIEHHVAKDKLTEKCLLQTPDSAGVETVLIRERQQKRSTACLSTALGCTLGCRFCASAEGPFIRHLGPGEMVEQVREIEHACSEKITNVVFMGTGEPFLNYDAVLRAARRLNAPDGFRIGARHITISTVGVIPSIERFAAEPEDFRLAVSLHAPTQAVRERIVPSARKWPLPRILDALRRYTRETRREVTFEYILISGVNASQRDAEVLTSELRDIRCKINLIPLNPWPGCEWTPPSQKECRNFAQNVMAGGIRATLRAEKGRDINAACGQLRARRLAREE
jgi:23S rRNA (adenine2503-C2)-methyltransferase